jgi:hypothetical protein
LFLQDAVLGMQGNRPKYYLSLSDAFSPESYLRLQYTGH